MEPTTAPEANGPPSYLPPFEQATCARALFLGERLDLRALERGERLAASPLVIRAGERGCAVLFRHGSVVLFGLTPLEEVSFLAQLAPMVNQPFEQPELEEVQIEFRQGSFEGVEGGQVVLQEASFERFQLLADALAKSAVLNEYEKTIGGVFDDIEPIASDLQRKGGSSRSSRELVSYIGGTLRIQHRTIGRVEIAEKPEVLWEHPELEKLYNRLSEEYELSERLRALDSKLQLIAHTAGTLLDLIQNRRSLRVEWYITILIVFEILLTLYSMFIQQGGH